MDPKAAATDIARRLQQADHTAYFAGGCVRDELLGLDPHDYDIATSAKPPEVQKLFPHTQAVGAHFGVILVMEHGRAFEVATFRSDHEYVDGRRPEMVTFSTPEEDAERRDFTINGMFHDPVAGKFIDFVGGRADLENKTLRAIGDPVSRFREDKLRLLRAVRFAARFGYDIDPATWDAIKAHAADLHAVSAERIREELVKILAHPSRVRGFDLLDQSGLLKEILPEIEKLKGCEQPPQFHPEGDVFVHTRAMLELLPPDAPVGVALSVLFHDIGKPPTFRYHKDEDRIRFSGHDRVGAEMTERVMERLRFSRADTERTVEAVRQHMVFKDVQNMRTAKLKRFMAREGFGEEMELHRVDCQSSHGALDNYDFLKAKAGEFANEPLIPPPLLTGHDLMALGWKPGPHFGPMLEAVQTAQLEGTLSTKEDAIAWIKANYPL
ncbi:MAG: CCA tRNA nucleotidyltransferase [Chthoniobacterales bacterium]|nr:CCA tRNA nucleotidyltransferase [Chthoniobacterales bacterium]